MHRFQPSRASPPLKANTFDTSGITDLTQSVNGPVAPELQNLTAQDIEILDGVIKRAGPSATTFFTIFKAYSEVLKEHGIDPQEVVYYGKLLKLGTLKGKNWGDKWEAVKAQLNQLPVIPTHDNFPTESGYHPYPPSESRLSDDQYSSVSQTQVSKHYTAARTKTRTLNAPAIQRTTSIPAAAGARAEEKHNGSKKFSLDAKEFPILASIAQRTKMTKQASLTLNSDEEGASSSPVPPSYRSTAFDLTLPSLTRNRTIQPPGRSLPPPIAPVPARQIPSAPKEKARVIDLDDAWKNVKMEQDEKFADKFREDMLLARCWEMWRQGFLWITTTHRQIGEARDKLVVRLFMQRWQARLNAQRIRENEMVKQYDIYRTKHFWKAWQARLKHRRQTAWRNEMRQKLKIMKNKTDARLLICAWKKWRQINLGHRADAHYQTSLLHRYHTQWSNKLLEIDNMQNLTHQFVQSTHFTHLRRAWSTWKSVIHMRRAEHIVVQRVNCRILVNSLDAWRKRIEKVKTATAFRDQMVMKHSFQRWKKAVRTLTVLDNRVEKHLLRQDEFLLRAIFRIWRARTRGKRLEQLKTISVLNNAWGSWKARIESHNVDLDLADKFLQRSDARLAASTLIRWHQILTTHRNAHQYAVEYHATQLRARALLLWRLRLRDTHQSAKVARWADKFFSIRRAWRAWATAMEERKRQERLKQWDLSRARKILQVWKHRAKVGQYFRQCETIVSDGVKRRIISNTLARWTNRVIEIKSTELDVVHRYNVSLMRSAFAKWNVSHRQHIEQVSLLENYLLVKQEDILRRAFHRWLTVKRAAEMRRLNHQRKEEQLRQLAITSAWEKWRERFKEEKLRPLEYTVILADQRNVLSRAFTVWLSKTYSLPAVRFYSKHVKQKFFQKWHNAMPNAMRMKKARETDRYNTIVRTFEKWAQAYKTKITLKAVARAKSLRLPPTSPREIITKSRPLYSGSQGIYSRRLQPAETDESQTDDAPLPGSIKTSSRTLARGHKPRSERSVTRSEYTETNHQPSYNVVDYPRRSFIPRTEFIAARSRSERSVPRSDYGLSGARQPSPVRSIVSVPDKSPKPPSRRTTAEGSTLWTAIKDLPQRRPRNL